MRSRAYRSFRRTRAAFAAVPLIAAGCNSLVTGNGPYACTAVFVFGISATALDATTNANITPAAYMIVSEGAYRDSVSASPGGTLAAAGERAGTYTVTIGHPGYSSFTQTNVVVNTDRCHVIPVSLQARLLRNP